MKIFYFLDWLGTVALTVILCIMAYHFVRIFKSKEYYRFWSPITFILLTFFYYAIYSPIADISSTGVVEYARVDLSYGLSYSYIGACLSMCSILIGFKISRFKNKKYLTGTLQTNKILTISVTLFVVGILCYGIVHPVTFSIIKSSDTVQIEDTNGSILNYLAQCISFLVCACCLFLINIFKHKRYYLWFFILFALTIFIVGGFRYRIVYLVVSMATMYHLYFQKKIKYVIWIPITIGIFLFFGLMNFTRSYSRGLDLSQAEGVSTDYVVEQGKGEGTAVFYYSGAVMKQVEDRGDYIYFAPLVRAIMQPVPRKLYTNKPGSPHLAKIQLLIIGDLIGAAHANYAEGFWMFGWIGVIFNGLFLGWLSKYFWLRYLRNRESTNSILLLALFNGFTYVMISRGHLSQELTIFVFFLVIPYFFYKKFYYLHK
jgi:oligosaccharide repeat unit polymerase